MKETSSFLLVASLLALRSLTFAQTVPPLINYQRQLSDAAGNPLPTADYVLTFSIHDAATGGSQVWGPQIFDGLGGQGHGPKIPVVQGFFNVLVGPVDISGRSLADAFNASNRWMQIRVGTNNPITPRQQILNAPFALQARNAQLLNGQPAGAFVAKAGDTMTGRLNLPADGLAVGGDQLVVSQGRVGIGVTPTLAALEVRGDWWDQRPALRLSGRFPTLMFLGDELCGGIEWRLHHSADGPGNLYFARVKDGEGALVLTLTRDGNVGIGITPDAGTKLEVYGTYMAPLKPTGRLPLEIEPSASLRQPGWWWRLPGLIRRRAGCCATGRRCPVLNTPGCLRPLAPVGARATAPPRSTCPTCAACSCAGWT